jgi:hypothetical protein
MDRDYEPTQGAPLVRNPETMGIIRAKQIERLAELTEENAQLVEDLRVSEALVRRLLEDREKAAAEVSTYFNRRLAASHTPTGRSGW